MGHEIPRHWRLRAQRYRLMGEICENGHPVFPPRDICPDCHGEAHIPHVMSGRGEIYSATLVTDAPSGFEGLAPYQIAEIDLEEGPRVTAQLTDLHDVTKIVPIGTKVEMVTRKLKDDSDERGEIVYGYKFRPVLSSMGASSSSR